MHETYAATGQTANFRGDETCTDFPVSCTISSLQIAVTDLIRARNPRKTWAFVADLFGLKERAAKHRLANTRCYTIEELQALLQTEDGLDFLVAVMGDAQPAWWCWLTKVIKLAAVRRRQAEDTQEILKLETTGPADAGARRRIKGALNADKRISAAMARAETTLGFQRPDVSRVGVPRISGMAGPAGRGAVAQRSGRTR